MIGLQNVSRLTRNGPAGGLAKISTSVKSVSSIFLKKNLSPPKSIRRRCYSSHWPHQTENLTISTTRRIPVSLMVPKLRPRPTGCWRPSRTGATDTVHAFASGSSRTTACEKEHQSNPSTPTGPMNPANQLSITTTNRCHPRKVSLSLQLYTTNVQHPFPATSTPRIKPSTANGPSFTPGVIRKNHIHQHQIRFLRTKGKRHRKNPWDPVKDYRMIMKKTRALAEYRARMAQRQYLEFDALAKTFYEGMIEEIDPNHNLPKLVQQAIIFGPPLALLVYLMLTAPLLYDAMKGSDNELFDIIVVEDDSIDSNRQLWNKVRFNKTDRATLEEIVERDSRNFKATIQETLLNIIESEQIKAALSGVLKELWTGLVEDPETVHQVVHLLQRAIENQEVKIAAQQLVLDLINDLAVRTALVEVIQQLGAENDVQQATKDLLVNSAHRSLTDPEIREHSMEFATDVLGDDIVQQTAGDALRNTVGHAFRPAAAVTQTMLGAALIIFGLVALGYARSTDAEVMMLEKAASSLSQKTSFGILRIVTWPGRTLYDILQPVWNVLYFPVQAVIGTVKVISLLPSFIWGGLTTVARGFAYTLLLPVQWATYLAKGVVATPRLIVNVAIRMSNEAMIILQRAIQKAIRDPIDGTLQFLEYLLALPDIIGKAITDWFLQNVELLHASMQKAVEQMIVQFTKEVTHARESVLSWFFDTVQKLISKLQRHWRTFEMTLIPIEKDPSFQQFLKILYDLETLIVHLWNTLIQPAFAS